ncbi:MAG: MmcQ/YjbR family DNA-binding protein [Oscillospiraceae bacterium]|nr:MmcQ/YjbR family DNA-binding protein [Oscillospiraceae bacterium]
MDKKELYKYISDQYGDEPDYPWDGYPMNAVFRHRSNRKWYALVMDVPRQRLGQSGEGVVTVMNVKCGPILMGSYLGCPGILPAYHMNKTNWVSVLLDGSARDGDVIDLLNISYDMTKGQ